MTPTQARTTQNMDHIPNPNRFDNCFLYLPRKLNDEEHRKLNEEYRKKLVGRSEIAEKKRFAMLVNAGMAKYIKKFVEGRRLYKAVLIYSIWEGYKERMVSFLKTIKSLGIEIIDLHVSGHADIEAINKLIATTHPTTIQYVHTDVFPLQNDNISKTL